MTRPTTTESIGALAADTEAAAGTMPGSGTIADGVVAGTGTHDRRQRAAKRALLGLWGVTGLAILATLLLPAAGALALYAWSTLPIVAAPTAMAWWVVRTHRGRADAAAWWCFAVAVTAAALSDAIWFAAWVATGDAPSGPWYDLPGLCFGPGVLLALLLLAERQRTRQSLVRVSLDAALLTASSATVLYGVALLLRPAAPDPMVDHQVLSLVFMLADGAAVGGLVLTAMRERDGVRGPVLRWLGLTLATTSLRDLYFATTPETPLATLPVAVQIGWYVFWGALGTTALLALTPVAGAPRSVEGTSLPTRERAPYLMAIAAYAMLLTLVVSGTTEGVAGATVGVGVVTLVALARQWLGAAELRQLLEAQLRAGADARLAALVRHGSDMVTILDADTTVRYASPSHLSIVGIPPEMLIGRKMAEEIHRDDLPAAQRGFTRLLSGESTHESLIVRLRDATGQWRWIEAVGTNLIHEPSVGGLVLNSRDISDRKQLEAQLTEQARRDPLTGLGNRRLFTDRVHHALERRARQRSEIAVLFCDLDHFKLVNDTLGHARGDALLVAVADRLRAIVRTGDTVARLGGDEFAILLEDLESPYEADETADRILQALSRPFQLEDRDVHVGASVGIAVARAGQTVDDLVTDADVAMYGAKAQGRARVQRFSTEMRDSISERVQLEADLRRAIDREELVLHYQPVVDLQTGRISGAEALVRWQHPTRGLLYPPRFIPVAEESELIEEIGRWVLRRGAQDAARFRALHPEAARMRVAVNLSARHLLSPDLESDVLHALREARIPGTALAIELTESMLATHEARVATRLADIRTHGVTVALDDFGTGYSSLAYLRRFPIDVLKIDKGFLDDLGADAPGAAVMAAIIAIGRTLGMRTVAEGVESHEQLAQLRAMGCSIAQGYLLGRPMPAEALSAVIHEWDATAFATGTAARLAARPRGIVTAA